VLKTASQRRSSEQDGVWTVEGYDLQLKHPSVNDAYEHYMLMSYLWCLLDDCKGFWCPMACAQQQLAGW
jgi:hypothetical protein